MVIAWTAGFFFFLWAVACFNIVRFLEKKKVKINYWMIRFYLFQYAGQYKKVTREETGQVGSFYPLFVSSFTGMMGSVIIFIVLKLAKVI